MTAEAGDTPNRHFAIGLARAFAGALIFSIAMLMTMEMWWLGFYMAPGKLALFTVVTVLLLVRLAHDQGFHKNITWRAAVIDAFVGYAVGVVTAAIVLSLLGIVQLGMAWDEIVGKVAIQAIPGAIGALLARSQLGENGEHGEGLGDKQSEPMRYGAELFTMVVGALYIAFNVAPTEEMELISFHDDAVAGDCDGGPVAGDHACVCVRGGLPGCAHAGRGCGILDDFPAFHRDGLCAGAAGLPLPAVGVWAAGGDVGDGGVDDDDRAGVPGALGAAAARLIL